jgi:hypothetical protein
MLINRIREAVDAKPFREFTLCLTDGQRVEVTHPHNVLIPQPPTRDFVVATPDGLYRFVDALPVSTLEFRNVGRGPRGGNGPNGRKRKSSS